MKKNKIVITILLAVLCQQGRAQEQTDTLSMEKPLELSARVVPTAQHKLHTLKESTGSVSIVYSDDFNKRSSKDVANSLFGYGTGLTVLQSSGSYGDTDPTLYVRGLQSLSTNTPLILVDGIERDITDITPEEVESVAILKDAAALALYGYKGINGAVNITTKRGKYNTREINFNYDHGYGWQARRPKFVDAYTYASAVNEALTNDGSSERYSSNELAAFKSGAYPYLYPNVDWIKETFRNHDATNIYNISFRGGARNFRYYAMANLTTNKGFIGNPYTNVDYSTQDQYSRANLRTNLDIDLTPKTKLKLNVMGVLSEHRMPGADGETGADLWEMIYTLPSAAFPVSLEDGTWGGSATWEGTSNPVAVSQDAGYTKLHERTLFADMTLTQDLSSITPGLGASVLLSYDNSATYWEDHSKTFVYGSYTATWSNGMPTSTTYYTDGSSSSLGEDADCIAFTRVYNFAGTVYYDRQFGKNHSLYGQLKYDYEYRNTEGVNETYYRNNFSLYGHYGYKNRYFADLTVMASGSNKLAPGSKWAVSPTLGLAWVASEEKALKDVSWIDFLKVRASAGVINTDYIPTEYYWQQNYESASYYPFDTSYSINTDSWALGQLASTSNRHEKAYKYNFGFDATLFKGLDLTADAYYERRSDIWVSSEGNYSTVLGFDAPYENGGIVDSWGFELGANYRKRIGALTFNVGANFSLNRNKIVEQMEEPQIYDNLVTTGNPLKSTYGLIALGFFEDDDDIANSAEHTFSDVVPGDIKYKDVNGDGLIDSNDEVRIGYSTTAPEIYYSFNLGAEWKGWGFNAMFQGAGRYSAVLNTTSVYWPLISDTNISEEYYNNRWTTETAATAKYPRLSEESNENNYQTNTLWLADRSFLKLRSVELYYNFPDRLLKKTGFLNKARIYVRGVDLLCFDHIKIADPEVYGATDPVTRSIVTGLSVSF
ncbi:MAG: SusC/RagA family TonB-linked outer membrane protein [Bacteroides sp.]|nr:SusC/RagA family TonB-linked outer membrane protein [Bacteroides sp.]